MIKRLLLFMPCLAILMALLTSPPCQATVTVNSTYFPDDSFRAAVASAAGVSSNGGTFSESSLTTLDLPSMGVSDVKNLTGLGLLTGLTYLDISGNSQLITGADITTLRSLRTLKARNCNIVALDGATGYHSLQSYTGAGLKISSNNSSIVYLDLSQNSYFYLSGNLQYLSNLETLLLKDCTYYDLWGYQPGNGMVSLKWVDVSGCSSMNRVYLRGATQLKHLNAEGTLIKGFTTSPSNSATTAEYIVLSANSPVEYINIANCAVTNEGLNGITTYNVTALDTLIVEGNSAFGNSTAFDHLPSLTYLDISNCDIYFRTGYLLNHLTPGHNPNLKTLLVNSSNLGSHTEGITGFSKLKKVEIKGNPNIINFGVSGSPLLQTLDISGDIGITELKLNDDALPRNDFSLIGANGNTPIPVQSLYLNGNHYGSIGQATGDFSDFSSTLAFLYLKNNSGFTGGPLTLSDSDCGGLTGLDLSNNGFTSFEAPYLPASLTALMIGKNPSMTRLEMHNNPGITKMTADSVMTDGSGLYLLGNTALTYMDISGTAEQPNYFQRIGNNFSLQGVPIDTIKGSYNKFYTFRNLNTVPGGKYESFNKTTGAYGMADNLPYARYYYSAFWPTMAACPDSASVEQLTALRYLDLSHCQLKDSLYLHKNTELRYLDVSHNRTIARYTTSQNKGEGYRASDNGSDKTQVTNRDYPDYKKYLWLAETKPKYPYRQQTYDQEYYTKDYNDTTGLYILDLMDNDKLEYLDISYTGIQQTAATHCHVSNARFIWIQDLHNLKYFYADYNGMRSMGIGTLNGKHHKEALKSLERLSVIGMRGADVITMQGSINFLNNGRCPNLHYVNVSYSDFDSIGVHNPNIDTLIVRGNPIHYIDVQDVPAITYIDARECAFKQRGYDPETNLTVAIPDTITQRFKWTYYDRVPPVTIDSTKLITMNGARDPGNYEGELKSPYSGLRAIYAHHRPELTTLLVNKSNALRDVYCYFDPKLTRIDGFDDLPYPKDSVDLAIGYQADTDSLNLVWVNDDYSLIDLNLTRNVNLHHLHAYNDKALGQALGSDGLDLSNNENLISAWVSNSCLERLDNGSGAALDTLLVWDNPKLAEIDVRNNSGLKKFDLRNCRVRYLDMSHCYELQYFDCSNDSIKGKYDQTDWFGFALPRACPVPDDIDPDRDGKNAIADLQFSSNQLRIVKADNNDLFSLKGLNDNPHLDTLSYCYNHINAIDLSGCTDIKKYRNTHNGRGVILAELSLWKERDSETGETNDCSMYYLQLKKDAGDAISDQYDTFLGYKMGHDSLEVSGSNPWCRYLEADGFIAARVDTFNINAAGPYHGNRGNMNGAPRQASVVYGPEDGSRINPDKIYGDIAVLRKFNETRNYIEYTYFDGRPGTTKDGNGKTSTFYLVWGSPGTQTDVEETIEDDLSGLTIVNERYYDISGAEHNEPFSGVNIIVRQMSDGSTQTVKVMR